MVRGIFLIEQTSGIRDIASKRYKLLYTKNFLLSLSFCSAVTRVSETCSVWVGSAGGGGGGGGGGIIKIAVSCYKKDYYFQHSRYDFRPQVGIVVPVGTTIEKTVYRFFK